MIKYIDRTFLYLFILVFLDIMVEKRANDYKCKNSLEI